MVARATTALFYPTVFVLVAIMLGFIPINLVDLGSYYPWFGLMAVYYFSIFKPSLLPNSSLCVLAIIYDVLSYYPLGLHILLWVGLRIVIITQRKILVQQSFMLVWAGFVFVTVLYGFLLWVMVSAYRGVLPVEGGVGNVVTTLALYPICHRIFSRLHLVYLQKSKVQ